MILPCTCISSFQDKLYGPGKRVANQMKNPALARCTCCGKQLNVKVPATKPVEEKK